MASHTTNQPFVPPGGFAENNGGSEAESLSRDSRAIVRLPAVLGMRHLVVLMVLVVLTVSNMTEVQFGGLAAFAYWLLALFTFLMPSAFVTQWLARRFGGQGSCYLWATRILGPAWSFFAAFCLWWPGLLTIVIQIESGFTFVQSLAPSWFATPTEQGFAILLFLCMAAGITCLPLRWLKHLLLGIAALYLLVWMALGAAGMWWIGHGHAAAVPLNLSSLWHSTTSSLSQTNGENNTFALIGLVVAAFLGVNVPLFLSSEIRGGRRAGKRANAYVWWGAALSFVAFVTGTFGIMVIVPPDQASALTAGIAAVHLVFGAAASSAAALALATSQLGITIAYLLVFSRLLVVLARDRRLPVSLTQVNRHGVPVRSIVVQAASVAGLTLLIFVVVPSLLSLFLPAADLVSVIYDVLDAAASTVWLVATALLFGVVLWLLTRHRRWMRIATRERVLVSSLSLVGIGVSLLAMWGTVTDSVLDSISDAHWMELVIGTTLLVLVVGWGCSEIPRMRALLGEQRRVNKREVALRGQLQASYDHQQVLMADLDRLYQEQARAAVTDPITGLPNHRAVMSRIEEELSRCQRAQRSCAVLFVDLDHFKHVNDTCGHRAGDAILHEVGSRLRTTLRLQDFVGRYGGEEFAAVLTDADLAEASQAAERLRLAIAAEPCHWEGEDGQSVVPIAVTASIGVAVYQLHGLTREALIEAADGAMYAAKHRGRNRVHIADVEPEAAQAIVAPVMSEQTRERVVVQALTAAASAHDRSTSAHAQRMIRLAEATAHALGRPEEERHLIRLGALLHDIGKIGIPETILHKPGPLTDDEWEIMRRHPDIGRQILEQTGGIFHFLSHVVVAHHERWDGLGYPHGLAREAIPMSARILAVVDSYDAMTSDRPYRKALSADEARAELERCAGRQYDPMVVEVFLRVLEEEAGGGGEFTLTGTTQDAQSSAAQAIQEAEATQEEQTPTQL